jgi:hypothetical protein
MAAPGIPDAAFIGFAPPVLNSASQLAFLGSAIGPGVNSSNNSGIWSEGSGVLDLVAREGMHAPGTPSGLLLTSLSPPSFNAAGQSAFTATLIGDGVDATNDRGIWATSLNGRLKLIAREGKPLEVAPSDFRTISSLFFYFDTGNEDGRPSSFNDSGQLAFYATFTDGSEGVFVSNAVLVPEPTAVALAVFALIGVLGMMRRRVGGSGCA